MRLGEVARTWLPLAASWLVMGLEMPVVSAIIARLADPEVPHPDRGIDEDHSGSGRLRGAGFADTDIFDIIEVAAFYNMSNRFAIGLGIRPNADYYGMGR